MIQVVTYFKAADGSVFDSREAAERHEAILNLNALLVESGMTEPTVIADYLVQHAEMVAPLLWELAPDFRSSISNNWR